jgi:PAS domain S-box-containing protein
MRETATEVTVPTGTARAAAWFFDNTLDVFAAVQGETLKALNGRWATLTGWLPKHSLERSLFEFVHPDDVEAARPIIAELPFGERVVLDLRVKPQHGAWLSMETQIVRGEENWLLMILRDVTAERQRDVDAEEALQAAILLQETAGITIWRFNPQTDEYDVDPDFAYSGRAMREFNRRRGMDVRRDVHPGDAKRLLAAWQDSIATGAAQLLTYRTRGPDNEWRRVRASWRGVRRLPSGQWELLGIAQDITELAAALGDATQGEG